MRKLGRLGLTCLLASGPGGGAYLIEGAKTFISLAVNILSYCPTHRVDKMEYLLTPGESCYSPSEAQKLVDQINAIFQSAKDASSGVVEVTEIRGVWLHYTHLKASDRASMQV